MPVVKLNATSSSNDFLKELAKNQELENFTVVTAELQTSGRGQMGATWHSESGKNLIMSILILNPVVSIEQLFTINVCVSLAVYSTLKTFSIPRLSIKWPNDIMSGNFKIGGILIENTIRSNTDIIAIAGIGINVNQTDFTILPNASSLRNLSGVEFDRNQLLDFIIEKIRYYIGRIEKEHEKLWAEYNSVIFKTGIPTAFELPDGKKFMAIISHVSKDGLLQLKQENGATSSFKLKEIKLLY